MGRGLFATALISQGEKILEFTGSHVSFLETIFDESGRSIQLNVDDYLDLVEPGVLTNHSCAPNAGVMDDRFLVAIADILPGEQIFFDYSTTMQENYWTLTCTCGAPACRGVVKDFRYLPVEVQNRYLDMGIVQLFIAQKQKLHNKSLI